MLDLNIGLANIQSLPETRDICEVTNVHLKMQPASGKSVPANYGAS